MLLITCSWSLSVIANQSPNLQLPLPLPLTSHYLGPARSPQLRVTSPNFHYPSKFPSHPRSAPKTEKPTLPAASTNYFEPFQLQHAQSMLRLTTCRYIHRPINPLAPSPSLSPRPTTPAYHPRYTVLYYALVVYPSVAQWLLRVARGIPCARPKLSAITFRNSLGVQIPNKEQRPRIAPADVCI